LERLTFEDNFCDIAQCRDSACRQDGTCTQRLVWERLKAYEDAGLSPQACAEAREIEETLSGYDYSISRMVELMKADKDGRVIVLPAKKGDTLYAVTRFGIEKRVVKEIAAPFFYNSYESSDRAALPTAIRNFGKTVFLSREEAEKALQEMEGK
jgi:hypothetical protein